MRYRSNLVFAISLFIPGLLLSSPVPKIQASYLKIKASQGDGAYSILRKYKLLDDPGNLNLFYKLNKIGKNKELKSGSLYVLPVKVYAFDGRSIRSSIGISDLDAARKIESYNSELLVSKTKPTSYKKDRKVYVPERLNQWTSGTTRSSEIERGENSKPSMTSEQSTNNAIASKTSSKGTGAEKSDRRKQFLVGSFAAIASREELVAERKLSPEEIRALPIRALRIAGPNLGSALKVSSKTLSVPLFGAKYSKVDVTSSDLNNQVFYIIPGHGGPDPGAIAKNVDGNNTLCEDEYAYDVSLRLAKNLMERGAMVYIIVEDENDGIRDDMYLDCDTDEVCFGGEEMPRSQKKRLKQGISKVNKLYNKHKKQGFTRQWMVSLHIDAQSEENRQDVFFYYQSDSRISKNKALDIQKVFEEKYQIYRKSEAYSGTVSARPLYVVRNSEAEPIYVELANINNPEDRKRLIFPKNRQLLADWITEGFAN